MKLCWSCYEVVLVMLLKCIPLVWQILTTMSWAGSFIWRKGREGRGREGREKSKFSTIGTAWFLTSDCIYWFEHTNTPKSCAVSTASIYHWRRFQIPASHSNTFEVKEFFSLSSLMARKVDWSYVSQIRTIPRHPARKQYNLILRKKFNQFKG